MALAPFSSNSAAGGFFRRAVMTMAVSTFFGKTWSRGATPRVICI